MRSAERPHSMDNASRARIGLAVGLCLLLLTATAAGVTIYNQDRSASRVAHSMDIEVALSDLESSLAAVGRARAFYVASGDDASYAEYQSVAAQIPLQLKRIQSLDQ